MASWWLAGGQEMSLLVMPFPMHTQGGHNITAKAWTNSGNTVLLWAEVECKQSQYKGQICLQDR